MSLINEALKKAQKQRTAETPPLAALPTIGGEPATRIARRGSPAGFNTLLLRLGLGAAALVLVIGGLVLFLRQPAAPTSVAAQTTRPTAAPTPPTPPPSAPAQFVLNIPASPAKTDPVTAPAEPTQPPTKAPAGPAKMDLKAITYIETLRVTGIRASATDSKVLMNDRVYRAGNMVEHTLGLKLTGITADSLTFEDEQGARYTRNF